jgi:hypothetical protein
MLQKMEQMDGRRPSKLLADMHGVLSCRFGAVSLLFTQRLPQAVRTQLGEVDPGNPKALAA